MTSNSQSALSHSASRSWWTNLHDIFLMSPIYSTCLPPTAQSLSTNSAKLVANVRVDNADCLSVHCLITADNAVRAPKPVVTYSSHNIRSTDAARFEEDLRNSVLFTQPADTLNAYVDQLNDVLTELLDKIAPVRRRRHRPQKSISKWLSTEAVDAKRSHLRLERWWRATDSEADRYRVPSIVSQGKSTDQ